MQTMTMQWKRLTTAIAGLTILLSIMMGWVSAETTATFPIIADFEGGMPANWFVYGDWGGGVTINAQTASATLPGQMGASEVLSVTANVASWGGLGAGLNPPQNWGDYDAVSFWFYGENSGTTHEFEIQTAASDDRRATFVDNLMGWRQIILPFNTFGAGGAYDVSAVDNWVLVLDGTVGAFQMDDLQLVSLQSWADFEGGMPADWFVYGNWGGGVSINAQAVTVADSDPMAVPGQIGNNGVLSTTANVASWGGLGSAFNPLQDWSAMQGVRFWFYGNGTNAVHEFEIQTVAGDDRRATFSENFTGWQLITLPFATFGATAYDVSQVDNWVLVLDGTVGSFLLDELGVYGDAVNVPLKVMFDSAEYTTMEGQAISVTVSLNMVATQTITVTYATTDGSATAPLHYDSISGALVFPVGATMQTFTIQTHDNADNDDDRTVMLTLSNPMGAELGTPSSATLTIGDDEINSPSGKNVIIENYESADLSSGTDGDGNPIGYEFFAGGSSTVAITTTTTPPTPVPGALVGNTVLQESLFITSGSYSGFAYKFTDGAMSAWVPADWSSYAGIAFWLYGNNTGGIIFLDVIDNRAPGSTVDDAERWSLDIVDDFAGWQYFEFMWADFNRKDIGNSAPNDGFNLTEIHGYAFGGFGSQPINNAYYLDDVSLIPRVTVIDDFESGQLPNGTTANGVPIGYLTASGAGATIATTITSTVPVPLPGSDASNQQLSATMSLPTGSWAVYIHTFANDSADQWVPMDWSSYEGVCFWLYGNNTGGTLFVDLIDNRAPGSTVDDAERYTVEIADNFDGWQLFQFDWADFVRKDIGNGAPNDGLTLTEMHGYAFGGFGSVDMGTNSYYLDNFSVWGRSGTDTPLMVQFAQSNYAVTEGDTATITVTLNMTATVPVTVSYATAESKAIPDRDFVPTAGTIVIPPGAESETSTVRSIVIPAGATSATLTVETLGELKDDGDKNVMVVLHSAENAEMGFRRQTVLNILDNDATDPTLLDDFEGWHPFQTTGNVMVTVTEIMSSSAQSIPQQGVYEQVVTLDLAGGAQLDQTFVEPQDWTDQKSLTFWYYGNGSGMTHTVKIYDNQSATTANTPSAEWQLVWSDEFNDPAGTPPNPNIWTHELGDGSLNGIPGWGNAEFQHYTDAPANAATDGLGNLVITLDELPPDTDLVCYYGPCRYTSARLISWHKAEFEYGRIEARVKVPAGQDGLWPAFWALGTNIAEVGWPQSGEIDIMEYVSRIPNEIFGTLHGPGYQGGASFGAPYDFGVPVANEFHTYMVEWGPDEIHWMVDGIGYHEAVPADVSPNEWVYNHPFFLLLNVAIGGNFGGSISPDLTFPQETLVDYVRVYQAENSAECFEAPFSDDTIGWKKISLPFTSFVRSQTQPANAPNDGLGLNEVWGYGFTFADGSQGTMMLDEVRLSSQILAVNLLPATTTTHTTWIIFLVITIILLTIIAFIATTLSRRQNN